MRRREPEEGAGGGPEAHSHPGASVGVCFLVLGHQNSPGVPPTAHPRVSPRPPFPQVYTVVDEMFLAGEIRETSQTKVLKQLLMLQSLE